MFRRERLDGLRQRGQVGGDDAVAALPGQVLHQGLADLTTCTGHQDSFFSHMVLLRLIEGLTIKAPKHKY